MATVRDNVFSNPAAGGMEGGSGVATASPFSDPFAAGPAPQPRHRNGSGGDRHAPGVGGTEWFSPGSGGDGGSAFASGDMMSGGAGAGAGGGVDDAMDDVDNEPPLLEELGINFQHIYKKTRLVLLPKGFKELPADVMEDSDFAGPLVFCLALGFALLLSGKVHFGYIYGFGACGCLGTYTVLNLMGNDASHVDIYRVFSIHGYCLLPIVLLALLNVVLPLASWFGAVLALLVICWCTYPCTRFFESALNMEDHRWLIAYPVFLLYACFSLITIF